MRLRFQYFPRPLAITLILVSSSIAAGFFGGAAAAPCQQTGISKPALRLAVLGFSPPAGRPRRSESQPGDPPQVDLDIVAFENALRARDDVALVDHAIIEPAVAGIGYDGSVNMSRDEARRLGAAIGCDFFIVGKREVFPVSAAIGDEHQEAILGIMIVDARGGDLASFDFLDEKGATALEALAALSKTLSARIPGYVPRLIAWRQARLARSANADQRGERIEDLPDADSAEADGFKPPEFQGKREKPVYTPEADLADITATVEALAVFRSDGSVGEVVIMRWAGYGLEASAERAIRQLKFKPAERNGRPINVRYVVRYNFKRVSEPSRRN